MEEKPNKPTFVSEYLPLDPELEMEGEGEKCLLNTIQYLKFIEGWWIIKIMLVKRKQIFAAIMAYADIYGNIRFSKDNVFSISEPSCIHLKSLITNYIKENH